LPGKLLAQQQEKWLTGIFNKTFKNAFNYQFFYEDDIPFSNRHKFEFLKSEVTG
jgi:hypothetical protein